MCWCAAPWLWLFIRYTRQPLANCGAALVISLRLRVTAMAAIFFLFEQERCRQNSLSATPCMGHHLPLSVGGSIYCYQGLLPSEESPAEDFEQARTIVVRIGNHVSSHHVECNDTKVGDG